MEPNFLLLIVVAAVVGLLAASLILYRGAREQRDADRENPLATSTEGMKICPHCGVANLWTDATCVRCRAHLPG